MTDTEEDGSFRFEVPAGRYRLAAEPIGEETIVYYPQILELNDPTGPASRARENTIEFRLPERPASCSCVIIDAEGRPVSDATVRLFGNAPDGGSAPFGEMTSGAKGDFSFKALPLDYELSAESGTCKGVVSPKITVTKGQTTPVRVPLPNHAGGACR